jgi:hypothetical protein
MLYKFKFESSEFKSSVRILYNIVEILHFGSLVNMLLLSIFLKMLKKLTNIHLYTFISMCEDKVLCKTVIFRGKCEKEKNLRIHDCCSTDFCIFTYATQNVGFC